MCGVTVNQVFPANETWHPLLIQALSGIPDENYERQWANRFHETDLNETGRRGLGIN